MTLVRVDIRARGEARQVSALYDQDVLEVGRILDRDVVLPKGNVSKLQFTLRRTAEGIQAVDSRSACGTWVNRVKLSRPTLLGETDVVYAGDFEVRVRAVDAQEGGGDVDAAALLGAVASGASPVTVVLAAGHRRGHAHLARLALLLDGPAGALTWNNLAATILRWPDPASLDAALHWAGTVVRTWDPSVRATLHTWRDPDAAPRPLARLGALLDHADSLRV